MEHSAAPIRSRRPAPELTVVGGSPAPKLRLADGADNAAPSPALRQQDWVDLQWRTAEAQAGEPPRWSQRKSLAFIGLTCAGFWTCVALGAAQLLR